MQLITFDTWIFFLLNSFSIGYTLIALVCLPVRLSKNKKLAERAANIQYAANLSMAIGAVLHLIFWTNILYTFYSEIPEETLREYDVFIQRWLGSPERMTYFVLSAILLGLLMFIRRLRRSWILSFLLLLLINANLLFVLVTGFYHDYSPSPWDIYYLNEWVMSIGRVLLFGLLTFLLYLFLSNRKKLPYNPPM